jgi:hypothetical protein
MSKTLKYPEFKSTDSFSKLFCREFLVNYCVKNQRFSLDEEFNKKNAPYLSFLCGNMIGVGAEQENLYHYLHYLYKYADDEKLGHYLAFKASYSTCSALFRKEILDHLVELYQEVRETIEKEEEIKVPKYPMVDLLKEYGVSIKSLREIHYILSDKSDEELLEGDFPRNDDYLQWKGMYPLNYFVKANEYIKEVEKPFEYLGEDFATGEVVKLTKRDVELMEAFNIDISKLDGFEIVDDEQQKSIE